MRFRSGVLTALLAAVTFNASAQAPMSTASAGDLLPLSQVQSRHFEALDLNKLAEEDAFSELLGQPQRFAVKHESGITPAAAGTWEQVGDVSIWRYRVFADVAASFNFGFSRFHLPEGASLFVASADGKYVAGPYTAAKNAAHGQLWTPAIPASDVVIELNVPTSARYQVQLEIGSINQGYRGFGTDSGDYHQPALTGGDGKPCLDGGGSRSAACNTDVACLEDDDPWNEPRRSVAALQIGGVLNCTGSLLNNTANDGRMLFATASHCMNASHAPTLVAYWNYEWPSCRRPGAADGTQTVAPDPSMSTTGATFLARTRNPFTASGGDCSASAPGECSDFTLVEFTDAPDPKWNLYWAGWDRGTSDHPCSNPADPASTDSLCASIHHPRVDEKRITFVDQNLTTANIATAQGVHWFARWDQVIPVLPKFPAGGALPPSVTEGGSSGSPLYNASKRFVGVLSGGASFCGASPGQLTDQYGKLAHAWDGLGTATTRVRDYLDPAGTGVMTLDGRGGGPDPEPPVAGTIEDGTVERAFGEASFNSAGANGSDGPLAAGGDDIMFKTNWYFRVAGAAQETRFGLPSGMIYHASGDRATLFYDGLAGGAFDAELEVTVSEPGAGQAAQISNMTIHNLGSTPLTIDVFNYTDLDANGDFDSDSGTDASADGHVIIEVTDGADTLQVGGRGATAYQVNEWATGATELPQTLENTDVTNLNNSGLPFGPGDFTGTIQWASQSVPANGSIELRHGITRGTDVAQFFGTGPLPSANLGLALTATPNPVDNGENVTFTATVSNAGPEVATGVSFTLTLPAELTYQSASPAAWTCANASGVVTCELTGEIASGASAAALAIVALADANQNGTVTVDGLVEASEQDPVSANNAASADVEITGILKDLIFADGFEKDSGPVECKPLQLLQDPSFEATTSDAGPNAFWASTDSNGDPGETPFWGAAARTGSRGAWGGGWGVASTQTWSQRVTIPAGNPRFLNFWRNISATPTAGTLKAFVDGDEVYSINVVSEGVDGGFVTVSVDVSDHADGGEHEVKMEYAATGDDGDTFVDDVTLDCEAAPAVSQPVRTAPFRGSKHDAAADIDPSAKRKRM